MTKPRRAQTPVPSSGVYWYVGATQVGKTTKALADLRSAMLSTGRPAIILDLARAKQFEDDYHETCLEHVAESIWELKQSVVYSPSEKELDRLCELIQGAKDVCLLVDEANRVLSAKRHCSLPLLALIRTHAHARVNVFLTTQHFSGDIPAEARECSSAIYCFRCDGPASVNLIENEYGTPPRDIVLQETGQYVELLARRRNSLRNLAGDQGT